MCDISFLIPTIKPYDNYAKDVVEKITSINTKYTYEIVVYSLEVICDKRIKYIQQGKDYKGGAAKASNQLLWNSSGEYVVFLPDDLNYNKDIFKVIDFLKSKYFINRLAITGLSQPGFLNGECVISLSQPLSEKHPSSYSKCTAIHFPAAPRKTFEKHLNNHVWHPSFHHHYGDYWLSYYIYKKYGNPTLCPIPCYEDPPKPIGGPKSRYRPGDTYVDQDRNLYIKLCRELEKNPNIPYSHKV